ncbi:hypothetical protein [Clostridium sp.]
MLLKENKVRLAIRSTFIFLGALLYDLCIKNKVKKSIDNKMI